MPREFFPVKRSFGAVEEKEIVNMLIECLGFKPMEKFKADAAGIICQYFQDRRIARNTKTLAVIRLNFGVRIGKII